MVQLVVTPLDHRLLQCHDRNLQYNLLTPIGVSRLPRDEQELGKAIACICKALKGIHKLGWAHNDIRWPNVVCIKDEWFLIDSEYASKFGTPLPDIKVKDPQATTSSIASDLYQLGRLLDRYADGKEAVNIKALKANLTGDARYTYKSVSDIQIIG